MVLAERHRWPAMVLSEWPAAASRAIRYSWAVSRVGSSRGRRRRSLAMASSARA
ncbi:MAG: hypothetical protein ACRDS1_16740 [Pseudonocardiaceae bacterium]